MHCHSSWLSISVRNGWKGSPATPWPLPAPFCAGQELGLDSIAQQSEMFFEAISTKLWPLAYYAYYLLYVIYTFCFRQTTSEIFCLPCAHRGHDTLGHSQLLWPHLLHSRRCWPSHSAATMRVCLTTCAIRLWMSWIILTFRKVFWGHSNALELIRSIFKQDRNSPRQRKQSRLPEGAGNWPEGPEGGLLFKPSEASHSANSKDSNMKPSAVPARILATLSPVFSQIMISDSRAL